MIKCYLLYLRETKDNTGTIRYISMPTRVRVLPDMLDVQIARVFRFYTDQSPCKMNIVQPEGLFKVV